MSNINEKNQGPRWYVAHTYTGYENKVKDSIEKIVENRGLGHLIYDIKVPSVSEKVLDENGKPVLDKNGDEKISETKLFPSYVFVKMTMNDESWHVVRNITGVTGFVGPGSEPTPLTDAEVEMFQVEVITDEFKFNLGDKVKVVLRMRGRQQAYASKGIEIVNNFALMLAEVGEKEKDPKVEGRNIVVIVQPKKKTK